MRCYCCNLSLKQWSVDDDPWIEHARLILDSYYFSCYYYYYYNRWLGNCQRLIDRKGEMWIQAIKSQLNFPYPTSDARRSECSEDDIDERVIYSRTIPNLVTNFSENQVRLQNESRDRPVKTRKKKISKKLK